MRINKPKLALKGFQMSHFVVGNAKNGECGQTWTPTSSMRRTIHSYYPCLPIITFYDNSLPGFIIPSIMVTWTICDINTLGTIKYEISWTHTTLFTLSVKARQVNVLACFRALGTTKRPNSTK